LRYIKSVFATAATSQIFLFGNHLSRLVIQQPLNNGVPTHLFYGTHMKKLGLSVATAIALSLVGMHAAHAQNAPKAFDGFYGQLGIGYENVSPSFGNSGINALGGYYPFSTNIESTNSFAGTITAGYMFPVSKSFLLGFGAEFSPFESETSNYTISINGLGTARGTYKKENSYNLFLSAATPINDTGLLYGKVGYTGASIKSTLGSASGSQTYGGYSLSLGYKQYVTGSLYGFVEANYYNYGNSTSRNSGVILGVPYTES